MAAARVPGKVDRQVVVDVGHAVDLAGILGGRGDLAESLDRATQGDDAVAGGNGDLGRIRESYDRKLGMPLRTKAAYVPG